MDTETEKRQIAMLRGVDSTKEYINELNKFLDTFPMDKEAW